MFYFLYDYFYLNVAFSSLSHSLHMVFTFSYWLCLKPPTKFVPTIEQNINNNNGLTRAVVAATHCFHFILASMTVNIVRLTFRKFSFKIHTIANDTGHPLSIENVMSILSMNAKYAAVFCVKYTSHSSFRTSLNPIPFNVYIMHLNQRSIRAVIAPN